MKKNETEFFENHSFNTPNLDDLVSKWLSQLQTLLSRPLALT